ncbi:MAG: molecular chaperone HtpG [Halothiobacillaceae bacterium]
MSNVETHPFQTEVNQLLRLMIHSLYSNKEIFLRELVSNASDACDKLRFEALSDEALYEGDERLRIRIEADKEQRTVTISDNGIGMNRDEVIENIGTIARSGTRAFLEQLGQDKAKDAQLIGQFGVGFYSAFIVADRITLTTRRAGMEAEHGVRWASTGDGSYTLETVEKGERGTTIVLHLREDDAEFADDWRLKSIVRKYSDHITFPVEMPVERKEGEEAEQDDQDSGEAFEQVNDSNALWARPRNEIEDDEYKAFYKHVAHDWEDPLAWSHNRVEGKTEYTSLLFIPSRAPFDLWDRDQSHGVKLYVRRVFIMEEAEKLMPRYLRFVRGVIDSADLPLNVSREILQSSRVLDGIRQGSVKRVLSLLQDMADNEPEKYARFWETFGMVLKEGPAEDFANREQIAKLLRFASTHAEGAAQTVSLADYLGRMQEDQEEIFYIVADSHAAALGSPHLEVFRKKGIEVLLLSDRVDEWLVSHLTEFEGKKLKSVAKAEVTLDEGEKEEAEDDKQARESLLERLQKALGDQVSEVRASPRLVDSPSCLVTTEEGLSLHLQRLLKEAGQTVPEIKPILEVNLSHPLLKRAGAESDDERFADYAHVLFGQALLAEGGTPENAAGFVQRLNRLLA